jgi:hypothetical protein
MLKVMQLCLTNNTVVFSGYEILYASRICNEWKILSHLELDPLDLMYCCNYHTLKHFHSKEYSLIIVVSYESVTAEKSVLY